VAKPQPPKKSIKSKDESVNPVSRLGPWLLFGAYLIVLAFGLIHHELWRDEHQAWLLARDSGSLFDLIQNMKYDGHPVLWHSLLLVCAKFTQSPYTMQWVHFLLAAGFSFLLIKKSGLPLWLCGLILFSYFFIYEYGTISRNYAIGVFLTFVFCSLFPKRHENYLWLGLVLFFLANTSVFGLILAFLLGALLMFDFFYEKKEGEKKNQIKFIGSLLLALAGGIISLYIIYPKEGNSFPVGTLDGGFDINRLYFVMGTFVKAMFALPALTRTDYWNTSMFIGDATVMNPLPPLILFFILAGIFLKRRPVFLLYTLGVFLITGFLYYTLLTHARYYGHFAVLLVACLWLERNYDPKAPANKILDKWAALSGSIRTFVLATIFSVGVMGGLGALWKDYKLPFSGSEEAAEFIKSRQLDTLQMVGATDFVVSCLPSLLETGPVYYPEREGWGSFVIWDSLRKSSIDFTRVISALEKLTSGGRKALLVLSAPPEKQTAEGPVLLGDDQLSPLVRVSFLGKVEKTVVKDEKYFFYLAEKVESGSPP
jgi:hypothetical protein